MKNDTPMKKDTPPPAEPALVLTPPPAATKKYPTWEYTLIAGTLGVGPNLHQLNLAGQAGWEAVAVIGTGVLMKRLEP